MAKWDLSCVEKDLFHRSHDDILLDHEQRLRKLENQGPRPGEIRVVNYVDGFTTPEDIFGNKGYPLPLVKHRLEQFFDGTWAPIKVCQEDGDVLREVKQ
jgi:hypothetical protein